MFRRKYLYKNGRSLQTTLPGPFRRPHCGTNNTSTSTTRKEHFAKNIKRERAGDAFCIHIFCETFRKYSRLAWSYLLLRRKCYCLSVSSFLMYIISLSSVLAQLHCSLNYSDTNPNCFSLSTLLA